VVSRISGGSLDWAKRERERERERGGGRERDGETENCECIMNAPSFFYSQCNAIFYLKVESSRSSRES